jgi:hypothetical protein
VTPTKSFLWWALMFSAPGFAQDPAKSICLTEHSNVSSQEVVKALPKECSNVSITNGQAKGDYSLEAIKKTTRPGLSIERVNEFDFTLFDREGNTFTSVADSSLRRALKDLCHALKVLVPIEVVDIRTLTQSSDARGDTSGGVVGTVVNGATGRRTHTDQSSIYVVVNGEHALLDCYERRTGCSTIGPGKYYGEVKGDGIWVSYRMPITHQPVRNHYKLAGSW